MQKFPFTDLHSFKDYVGFVKLCAPDLFPEREGMETGEQWTLELAFKGLADGLDLSIAEKGNRPQFRRVEMLFADALSAYRIGDISGGYMKLDAAHDLLREVPSQ